jgi:hypothetical protein
MPASALPHVSADSWADTKNTKMLNLGWDLPAVLYAALLLCGCSLAAAVPPGEYAASIIIKTKAPLEQHSIVVGAE